MSTRGQDHCLTFVQGHSDLYFQSAPGDKLLGPWNPNFMYSIYSLETGATKLPS